MKLTNIILEDKSSNETKTAPAGHYYTASGNLVKGRLTKDAQERGARKCDPLDTQRSKTPQVSQYNEEKAEYDESGIKLMGDIILPVDKEMVLQAAEDKYNRGLLVTNNKDKSYDIAYWADKFEPYPIEVEIDGKSVAKDAKVIKLLFHPEMKEND